MSDKKFEADLLDVGAIMKQGHSYLIANGGKIVALLTLIVAVIVTFTDVSFTGMASYTFVITLMMMLAASYIMFFSLENAGEKLAEEGEEYRAAYQRYKNAKEKIKSTDILPLRKFCTDYSREELEYRRTSLLTEYGYTEEEYKKYSSHGAYSGKRALKAFKKCDKLRSVALTPQTLLTCEHTLFRSELINPEKYKLPYMLLHLIPSTLCMAFTVSIMLSTKDGLSVSSVIDGLFKLSALPIVGFRGYSEGYSYVKNSKTVWLETKSRLLESYISGVKN